ncbi:transcription initiation factor TFIID subunit 7-like [Babylonia areolata]|uniref:transcription initiation factor TFIID subunit 7-like n=1 Tax=Babylonia areolata TaxID=304850 RepID=UPI003FD5D98F
MNAKVPPKKKDGGTDGVVDLESQFILRLPQTASEELRQEIQSTSGALFKDKLGLSIELDSDMRHGHVRYNNFIFNAKVVDLPCIIESLKTVDKKTFYKTADICQMMVCTTDEEINVEDTDSPKKKDKDKRYLWNHGITRPLKNVRKRRFRKTMRKKYMDQPELEKEVRRLFRFDAEAIDVKWEVLTEDEKPVGNDAGQTSGHIQSSGAIASTSGLNRNNDQSVSMDVASFFGEVSSSEEEEDKEVNIMDSGEDDMSRLGESSLQAPESQDAMGAEGGDDTADLQEKLQELVQQLEEIREKRLELESQMAEEDNDMMRDRIREDLERFLQEESEKEKEHEILSAMLNQS